MKHMNLLNDVHDFIYLLKLAAHYTLSYILALRCEYRKKLWVIQRLIVTLLVVY